MSEVAAINDPGFPLVDDPIRVDYISLGEQTVREVYTQICKELDELRDEKREIQDRINELTEKEQLWRPLIHRLDNGIQRRSATE